MLQLSKEVLHDGTNLTAIFKNFFSGLFLLNFPASPYLEIFQLNKKAKKIVK